MKTKIVFKFRDDLLIEEKITKKKFKLNYNINDSAKYYDESKNFYQMTERKFKSISSENNLRVLWDNFMKILEQNELIVEFLFQYNKIETINKLVDRAIGNKKTKLSNLSKTDFFLRDSKNNIYSKSRYTPLKYQIPNFYNYFFVSVQKEKVLFLFDELSEFLIDLSNPINSDYLFENVYIQQEHILFDNQNYMEDIRGVSGNLFEEYGNSNAKGEDINVILIEKYWNVGHPQFDNNVTDLIFPLNAPNSHINSVEINAEHGTRMLGILKAKHDRGTDRCRGIVPKSNIILSSIQIDDSTTSTEGALLQAINGADNAPTPQSSVIVTALGASLLTTLGFPLEIEPAIYQLIKLATNPELNLKMIVVEAAGNSGLNFNTILTVDNIRTYIGRQRDNHYWNGSLDENVDAIIENNYVNRSRFIQDYLANHSGGILVGSTQVNTLIKNNMSNYDLSTNPRIRVFAQGENITTTNFNYNGTTTFYNLYDSFASTSGASAIIAGICASLQGIAKANNKLITPQKMLEYFSIHATDVQMNDRDTTTIGKIPNYKDIVSQLLFDIENNVI